MKKILVFLIFPMLIFGADTGFEFIVENTTMVKSYYNVFNAMALIFSSETYIDLLKLVFLIGGFFVFASGVLAAGDGGDGSKTLTPYLKYLIVGVVLITLFLPDKNGNRTTALNITTNNIPSFCNEDVPARLDNIVNLPTVLAFVFSATNSVGYELTRLAEQAFSTTEKYSIEKSGMTQNNGYMGAIKTTIKLLTINPDSAVKGKIDGLNEGGVKTGDNSTSLFSYTSAWERFFRSCVYEVAQNKGEAGKLVIASLENSTNVGTWVDKYMGTVGPITGFFNTILTWVDGHTSNANNGMTKIFTDYQGDINLAPKDNLMDMNNPNSITCGEYYETLQEINNELGINMFCYIPELNEGVGALLKMDGSSADIKNNMTGIAITSGLTKAFTNASYNLKDGNSGISYASAKTLSETNQENLATASYMAEMMPYLQMTMRAILYAFFPFVFVTALLPGGIAVLGQYAKTVLWIELWGPTAAIINMFLNIQFQEKVGNTFTDSGLTVLTSINMLSEANTIAAIGAMLYLSIPPLTWLILTGSGQMLGNLTTGISAKFSKNLDTKATMQDMQEVEKLSRVNKDREEKGQKALSYGEMLHYENMQTAAIDAGKVISQGNIGNNNLQNISQYDNQMKLEGSLKTINKLGGVNNAINDMSDLNSTKNAVDAKTNKKVDENYGGNDNRIKAQTDANVRKEVVGIDTENKKISSPGQESTANALEKDKQTFNKIAEAKTHYENIAQESEKNIKDMRDEISRSNNISKDDASRFMLNKLLENDRTNAEISSNVYHSTAKEIKKEFDSEVGKANEMLKSASDKISSGEKMLEHAKSLEEKGYTEGAERMRKGAEITLGNARMEMEKAEEIFKNAEMNYSKQTKGLNDFFENNNLVDDKGRFTDTYKDALNIKDDDERMRQLNKIKAQDDALGVKYINAKGEDREVIKNVIGKNITNVASAKQGMNYRDLSQYGVYFDTVANMSENDREVYARTYSGAVAISNLYTFVKKPFSGKKKPGGKKDEDETE